MEKRRVMQSVVIAVCVIICVVIVIFAGKLISKYTPTKEEMDLKEYYDLTEDQTAAIVLNHEVLAQKAVLRDGMAYLDYDMVRELFNSRFYWDGNENLLLYTTASDVISAEAASKEYSVTKKKNEENYVIVYAEEHTALIAIDYVKKFTDLEYQFYEEPNRMVITTDWSDYTSVPVKKNTQIRLKGGIKSPILKQVEKETELTLLEAGKDWDKVATQDGIIGYIRKKKLGKEEEKSYGHTYEEETFTHLLKDEKINMAWHQVTTKEANSTIKDVLARTKGLNVISPTWFYLNDNEGGLMNLSSKEYVDYCHSQEVEVWALINNLENKEVDSTEVLTHTSKRRNVVNQLIASAIEYNFDGINVDFEALGKEAGDGYVQFIRELSLKCENNGIVLSVDNYVPSDYTAFYDREEQANFADYIIMMGYDEHYAGSEEGSVASIGFVKQGIEDTLKEVPANQLILAAPFFTRVWALQPKEATDDVEAASEDYVPYEISSQAVGMEEAWNMSSVNGVDPVWSEPDGQYYAEYIKDGTTYKIWLEDERSMDLRLAAFKEHDLAGMSFWKLGLEESRIWDTILKYMN